MDLRVTVVMAGREAEVDRAFEMQEKYTSLGLGFFSPKCGEEAGRSGPGEEDD